ncbi:helix-turn-helix domain-containing protein [Hydrogenophaga atypica]|uniref:Helix-turn-helix domain-containing protein n=1 Tax=Hydrogenophaga atypica TaxID=249409 RepID=A0ABW2QU21_9BURK
MSKPDRRKKKAPGGEAGGVQVSKPNFPEWSDKPDSTNLHAAEQSLVGVSRSTSAEAQRDRIIRALRIGPQTSYDLRRLGCYQAPARIKELRDRFGYSILTKRVTLWDRDGWPHRGAALYVLESEPAVIGGAK